MLLGRRVRVYSRTSQDRIADIGAIATETLGAMKIVQAFGQENREGDRFEAAVRNGFAAAKRRFRMRALLTAMVIALLRSEEHTSELQSLMRISYAVFCLKKK